MSTPRLVIPLASAELPTCNPNLMPFHIGYTGPAPVSAFMRVEKFEQAKLAEEPSNSPEAAPGSSSEDTEMKSDATEPPPKGTATVDVEMKDVLPATPSTAVDSQPLSASASESTIVVESQPSTSTPEVAPSSTPPPPVLEDADRRFVSTFRGRTIHGLTIDLPAGYGGLLLHADPHGKSKTSSGNAETKDKQASSSSSRAKASVKGKEKEAPKSRGRLTRSAAIASKPTAPIVIEDEDEDMGNTMSGALDVDENPREAQEASSTSETPDDHPVRQLVPKAQFSSFTLWHADRPVEKSRDEYYRTLTEWISLAHEINHEVHSHINEHDL